MLTKPRATIEGLYAVPDNGKAELINGELVHMSPTGARPGRASGKIYASLVVYEEKHGGGYAIPDNVGFLVNLPGRQSFSPDAAWYAGPLPLGDLDFLPDAPTFAVEVHSKDDYGSKAERKIAHKIADYFAAGTLVVWDVDLLGADVIKVHRGFAPAAPTVFRRGDIADALPGVPGWNFPVDKLFG
jgi:Uma2 family endonuclease